jgi:hypothetical protein
MKTHLRDLKTTEEMPAPCLLWKHSAVGPKSFPAQQGKQSKARDNMVALEGVSPCLGISRHSLHNLYGCAGQDLLRPGDGENLRGKPLKNSSPQCKK